MVVAAMSVYSSPLLRAQATRPSRRRYCVDLAAAQAECETNYWRIERLLRAFADDDRCFAIGAHQRMRICVRERSPYTTLIEIATPLDMAQAATAIAALAPSLTVRVYHDARLAEVVAFAHWRRVLPRYDYPNVAMHQPDEKAQWNHFLSEWLSQCLQYGVPIDRPLSEFCVL